jgi:hypothetical protein
MSTTIMEEVLEQLKNLPHELQWRVLEFTHALSISAPRGVPGRQLLRFAGSIPLDDLDLMSQAIEQGCEQVDADEW